MQGLGPHAVFVDANVWYSRTARDWIGMLYTTPDVPPFAVFWTEDVMAEFLHGLRKAHPTWPGARTTQIRDRLASTFEAGRVDRFTVDGTYRGPDPHDAHVHAAALARRADILLTFDATGFVWDDNTSPYEVMHPDDFFVLVDLSAPALVAEATRRMCAHWLARSGEADLPARLRAAGCPQFADRVRDHVFRQLDR